MEYTIVGDTVNLAQRLQEWADRGQTVISHPTFAALRHPIDAEPLKPALVKGRQSPVTAYRIPAADNVDITRLDHEPPEQPTDGRRG